MKPPMTVGRRSGPWVGGGIEGSVLMIHVPFEKSVACIWAG